MLCRKSHNLDYILKVYKSCKKAKKKWNGIHPKNRKNYLYPGRGKSN